MAGRPEAHAPQARCDVCGSPKVFSVCHHCGRPACKDDSPATVDMSGKPLTREFAQLRLDQKGPHHCDSCAHVTKGRLWPVMAFGVTIALAGIVIIFVDLILGLSLLFLGT